MRTQVGIIGAGPAGLILAHLLHRDGIESVVLESRSRSYVEARVRAGVLESGTVDMLTDLGLDARLRRESMNDEGLDIRFGGKIIQMSLTKLAGRTVTIYGQQEVVKDLIAARLAQGQPILFEAEAYRLDGIDTTRPSIAFRHDGKEQTLECDFIAGCDGFHGICRPAVANALTIYDREFPFAWFGVMSRSPPISEMTYANSERGFALCSRRTPQVSRLYVQVPAEEDTDAWPVSRFWDELHARMGDHDRHEIVEGEIFQRDKAQLRSFVAEPMRHGRLFLTGDAVHIVPPTGAKGLNLAAADVRVLGRGLADYYKNGATDRLDRYSDTCLRRVWKTVRYSTYMTNLLHQFPGHSPFERKIQLAELDYILGSATAQKTVAENYVGLPFED